MKSVEVQFQNPVYNYTTSVNPNASDESLKNYFVGIHFNRGVYPKENLQKCVGIKINH